MEGDKARYDARRCERDARESSRRGAKAMHASGGPKPDVYYRERDIRAKIAAEGAERARRLRFT